METSTLKQTALHEAHVRAGAKLVPFAGYEMPVQYSGLKAEHAAVRQDVGMFDVSHMGEFFVEGNDAMALIQRVTSNDVGTLVNGKVQYSCMPNEQGGIVDDLLVYRFSDTKWMLVVNASNRDKDLAWIQSHMTAGMDARVDDRSDAWALIALQGPNAESHLQALHPQRKDGTPWAPLAYYTFTEGQIMGHECILSATGYTGSGGYELYLPCEAAREIWDALIQGGVTPCGLGARDTLRMEMGFCLYGNDIDDTTSPLAAGLGWITKFTNDFVGRPVLEATKQVGASERLIGLTMSERGIPRHGYEVIDATGAVVGRVTSGTMAPSLGHGIGMAYIEASLAKPGTALNVMIRNKPTACVVTRFPFYQGED